MKISGIYKITHIPSGRCYVGQAKDIHGRWKVHIGALNKGCHTARFMQRCWDKYGADQFRFTIIEVCNLELLTPREQCWIDSLKPEFNSCPIAGSSRGVKFSEQAKANISASLKGRVVSPETRRKLSEAGRRRSQSDETRRKIGAAHKGRTFSSDAIAKMSDAKRGKPLSEKHKANLKRAWSARRAQAQ
jgi:group I intron endonuclease